MLLLEWVTGGKVASRDRPRRVDAHGDLVVVSEPEGVNGPWRIKRREGALGAHEAVTREGITVVSRDRPRRVDGAGVGVLRVRRVKSSDGTVGSAHKAVIRTEARVSVVSRDGARRIDGVGKCALEKARSGTRCINRCDCAVDSAHEAVACSVRVKVVSRDHAIVVDCQGVAGNRPRRVKSRNSAVGSAHEAVDIKADVIQLESRDRARLVDAVGLGEQRARGVKRSESLQP